MIFAPICGFILLKKDAVNWCKSFIHFLRNLIHILANFAVNLLSIRDMKNEKACPNRFRREGDKYYYCCIVWFGKWIIRQVENCTKNTLTLVEELLFDDHQLYGKNLARIKGEKSGSTYLHMYYCGRWLSQIWNFFFCSESSSYQHLCSFTPKGSRSFLFLVFF